MRVLVVANHFPSPSETFILRHITVLIDRGCQVDILARLRSNFDVIQPDVYDYDLLKRTIYFDEIEKNVPRNKIKRFACASDILYKKIRKSPKILFNAFELRLINRHYFTLRPVYLQHFFKNYSDYDIIHCHFEPNGLLGNYLKQIGAINGVLVTAFHGYDVMQYVRQNHDDVYSALFSNGDLFLPACDFFNKTLSDLGCNETKIGTHRMGVDCFKLNFPHSKGRNTSVQLLYVGDSLKKKGTHIPYRQ